MSTESLDESKALALIDELVGGRTEAWKALVELLHPQIERIVRGSRSLGPLRDSDDHRRNVVTDALEKLARNDHRALAILRHWLAENSDKTLMDWLRIVVTNVARDYVEKQLGAGKPGAGMDEASAKKRLLHTLASALPADDLSPALRPPVTDQQTARQILEYAAEHLPDDQLRALEAWLRQADFAEVGAAAGLARDHAKGGEKLVRAALARLRRQFVVDTSAAD